MIALTIPKHTHVGVNIKEQITLFNHATQTTGRDRGIGLVSADAQLLTNEVTIGTPAQQPKPLGIGTFGEVHQRYVNSDGSTKLATLIKAANAPEIPLLNPYCVYATKIMKPKYRNRIETTTLHEFVPRNLDDPGIIKIGAAAFHNNPTDPTMFVTYLSMDKIPMTLSDLIHEANVERYNIATKLGIRDFTTLPLFAVNEYKMLAYQLIRSVAYLHSERIVHADIKPPNILISAIKKNVAKPCLDFVMTDRPNHKNQIRTFKVTQLIDFGLCRTDYMKPIACDQILYTINQRPPEFIFGSIGSFGNDTDKLNHKTYITPKSDIWAMGCVLYEMATKTLFINSGAISVETVKDNATVARQMIKLYGKEAFTDTKFESLFPCYNANMKNHISMLPKSDPTPDPWAHDAFKQYPGLKLLLQKMLVVDPMKRVNMFALLSDPFFTSSKVGELFNAALNVQADKFSDITYLPNTLRLDLICVIPNIIKSLPPACDPTHSSIVFNTIVFRRLVCHLPTVLTNIVNTTLKSHKGDAYYELESKVMALMHTWALKNSGNNEAMYDTTGIHNMVIAFISIVLKAMNYHEEDVLDILGYTTQVKHDTHALVEYKLLHELDFNVLVSTPYNLYLLLDMQAERTQKCTSYRVARNLVRAMYFNPAVVNQIDVLQLVDSAIDICVRFQRGIDRQVHKSFDPNYSQLRLSKETALQLIETITMDRSYAGLTAQEIDEIAAFVMAYHQHYPL